MITIDIDDREVDEALKKLIRRTSDLSPAMQDIGEVLSESTKQRFSAGVDPEGHRWRPNRPATIAAFLGKFSGSFKDNGALTKKGSKRAGSKKPLTGESKSLRSQIDYRAGRMHVSIGSAMEYAATQQFGAKKGAFGSTKHGVPIPWGDIPARRFLGLSDDDRKTVLGVIEEYLTEGK